MRETDPDCLFSSQAFWSQFALLSSRYVYFSIARKSDLHSFSRPQKQRPYFLIQLNWVRTMSYKCCTIGNRLSLQLALSMLNEFETSKTIMLVLLHPIMFITALILLDLPKSQDSSVHIVFSSSNPWPLSPDHLSDTLTASSREWHQNSWLLYEAFIFQYSTRLKYTFPFKQFFPRHRFHEVKYPSSSNKLLSPVQEIKSSHRLCFIKLGFIKINLSF